MIPIVDIAPARGRDEAAKHRAARALDEAAREIGFFAVTGHGLDAALHEAARAAASAFFALPAETKRRYGRPTREESRGFAEMGGEALGRSLGAAATFDLKESFAIGPVDRFPAERLGDHAYPHYTPNVWPAECPDMCATWERYYRESWRVADEILSLLAIALELPETWFADKTNRCYSNLRAQHYPALTAPALPGQLRAGAHTDYGALTVLGGEAGEGGLQIETRAGDWVDVAFPPDSFMVNIGDQLAMWSNDRWRSTLHRVAVPSDEHLRAQGRLTLGFFHMPNADAVISCLPNCTGPGRPPRYPDIEAGWHKRLKFAMANDLPDIIAAAPPAARRAAALR